MLKTIGMVAVADLAAIAECQAALDDLAQPSSRLRLALEKPVSIVAQALATDEVMQRHIDEAVEHLAQSVIVWRGEIGSFIAEVVRSWDTRTLSDRLELVVGSDLQYIRMNGTIVGAYAGCSQSRGCLGNVSFLRPPDVGRFGQVRPIRTHNTESLHRARYAHANYEMEKAGIPVRPDNDGPSPVTNLANLATRDQASLTSCPRSVVVFPTAVLRPFVVQTPTANPIVVAALARDRVTTDYRS